MKYCWDIKSCPFRGTEPAGAKCPAYASEKPCWEYDWLRFYRGMPEGPGKAEWRRTMLEWCVSCAVRRKHGEKIDPIIERLRTA